MDFKASGDAAILKVNKALAAALGARLSEIRAAAAETIASSRQIVAESHKLLQRHYEKAARPNANPGADSPVGKAD